MKETRLRYGQSVRTMAMESYGQLGAGSNEALEILASEAQIYGHGVRGGGRLTARWRASLERNLLYGQADVILQAMSVNLEDRQVAEQG